MVNRLVRLQYGPFSLGDMPPGDVREVPAAQVKELVDFLVKRIPADPRWRGERAARVRG